MRESQGYIERIHLINSDVQRLELAVDSSLSQIKPGQSLLAANIELETGEISWLPYLREHWWPVGYTADRKLIVERPTTTEYSPGQPISILAPVGQPFRFKRSLRHVLLIAYDSPPTPMLMMIPRLLGNDISVTLILLGKVRNHDMQYIPAEVEVIRGNGELQWNDQVMTLGWADQIFVTVAQDNEFLRFREILSMIEARRTIVSRNFVFGVFQAPLPCGTGACTSCAIRTKQGLRLICKDGPAFDLSAIRLPLNEYK